MIAASSADAPAATSNPLAISISCSAVTFGMAPLPCSLTRTLRQAAGHLAKRRNRRSVSGRSNRGADHGDKSNLYAGVAGYVGRADQVGTVGVFSRPAEPATVGAPSANTRPMPCMCIRPIRTWCSPAPRMACIAAPIAANRSSGRTSPTSGRSGRSWSMPRSEAGLCRRLADQRCIAARTPARPGANCPIPGMPDRAVMPFACRVMRMAQHP